MEHTLYQVALLQSLLLGNYNSSMPYRELLTMADTGIGTFEGMDGEMIALDGVVYQAKADGTVQIAAEDAAAPFCCMAKFHADRRIRLGSCADFSAVCDALENAIPNNERNLFHMAKLHGNFDSVSMRSVEGSSAPYRITGDYMPPNQQRFSVECSEGTAVALRCPNYMDRLNMPGWHLHFITKDKTIAGHVTEMTFHSVDAEISILDHFEMLLPRSDVFNSLPLTNITNDSVSQMER